MKKILIVFGVLSLTFNLYSIDITGFGGIKTHDWEKLYGVALAWDFLPFIQLELEGFRLSSNSKNHISANPLLSIDLASITPYITIGYGFSGEKTDISTYKGFRNYGAGVKFFIGLIGIRIDWRNIKNGNGSWSRIYGGLDLSF
ncbi:MAG: hypothetical protein ACUVUG_07170 [Candidatus Aminicenantia bacterium]